MAKKGDGLRPGLQNPSPQSVNIEYGKIPPQAIDLEEVVLGAILIEADVLDQVSLILVPEAFYKDSHQKIFAAMMEMYHRGTAIDILTLTEHLRKKLQLEEVGGPLYITQLSGKVSTAAHIESHALIIMQKYIAREMIRASGEMTKMAFDESVDVADIIEYNYQVLELIHNSLYTGTIQKTFHQIMLKAMDEYAVREHQAKDGIVPGIKTPIVDLDKITGGWMPTDLIIIAGRPGMGKTAFALSMIKQAAKQGKWVNVYSLEMSDVRLVDRMLVGDSQVDARKYRDGMLNPVEYGSIEESINRMAKYNILIDPSPVVKMDYILSRSRLNKKKDQCDMIVIDYLQLIHEASRRGNREQEVSEVSRRAKLIAKELNIPVVMLAQLNRNCELRGGDKRPMLADLRESGAIEQDADTVIFLYRGEVYGFLEDDDMNSTIGRGELIIAKQRNGKIGMVLFGYSSDLTRIYDYGEDKDDKREPDLFIEPMPEGETDLPF